MRLVFLKRLSLLLALLGLILIYLFSPGQQNTATSINQVRKSCSGPVAIEGVIESVSYSSNGNMIAELSQNGSKILVFLEKGLFDEGQNLSVFGKASKFSNQCWIFPDRVEYR
jgi:hypothetical protein